MPSEPRTVTYDPEYQVVTVDARPPKEDMDLDWHQRRVIFYLVIAALTIATLGSSYLAFIVPATAANHADKEWARNILASVIAGMVGYAFGKK